MNPYRIVHKGLRRELARLLADVGGIDTTDPVAVNGVVERWCDVRTLLDTHHRHEDVYIGPRLRLAVPMLFDEMESDHDRLHEEVLALSRRAEGLSSVHCTKREDAVTRFYLELADFTGRYFLHMGREETLYLAALHDAYTLVEVARIDAAIVRNLTPELVAAFLRAVLPAISPAEREELERAGVESAGAFPVVPDCRDLAKEVAHA